MRKQLLESIYKNNYICFIIWILAYGHPEKIGNNLIIEIELEPRQTPIEGLLKNKQAYLVITSGGTKLNSNEDFLTPWLKFILNFFGIQKVEVVSADQMALDYEKSIKDAETQIENISLS